MMPRHGICGPTPLQVPEPRRARISDRDLPIRSPSFFKPRLPDPLAVSSFSQTEPHADTGPMGRRGYLATRRGYLAVFQLTPSRRPAIFDKLCHFTHNIQCRPFCRKLSWCAIVRMVYAVRRRPRALSTRHLWPTCRVHRTQHATASRRRPARRPCRKVFGWRTRRVGGEYPRRDLSGDRVLTHFNRLCTQHSDMNPHPSTAYQQAAAFLYCYRVYCQLPPAAVPFQRNMCAQAVAAYKLMRARVSANVQIAITHVLNRLIYGHAYHHAMSDYHRSAAQLYSSRLYPESTPLTRVEGSYVTVPSLTVYERDAALLYYDRVYVKLAPPTASRPQPTRRDKRKRRNTRARRRRLGLLPPAGRARHCRHLARVCPPPRPPEHGRSRPPPNQRPSRPTPPTRTGPREVPRPPSRQSRRVAMKGSIISLVVSLLLWIVSVTTRAHRQCTGWLRGQGTHTSVWPQARARPINRCATTGQITSHTGLGPSAHAPR